MTAKQIWGKYKFWIIGSIVALIVLPPLYRLLVSAIDGDGDAGGNGTPGPPLPGFSCNPAASNRDKVISQGTKKSNEVCYLQGWLNQYYGAGLKVDGAFGPATRNALDKNRANAPLTFTLNTLGI